MSYLALQKSSEYDVYLYGHNKEFFIKNCNYGQIDARDKDSLKAVNFSVDAIFIFTGKTGTFAGFNDYEAYIDLNEKSLLNMLKLNILIGRTTL